MVGDEQSVLDRLAGLKPAQDTGMSMLDRLAEIGPPTLGQQAQNVASSLVRGVAEIPASVLEAKAIMDDAYGDPTKTGAAAQWMATKARELAYGAVPPSSKVGTAFWEEDVPTAFGSGLSFMGGGAAAQAVKIPPTLAVGLLGGSAQAAGQYADAMASGSTEDQAWAAYLLGFGVGATEAVPIARILRRANAGAGGGLERAFIDALVEGGQDAAQESFQQAASNIIAAHLVQYDEDREVFDEVLRNGAAGAFSGVVLSALGSAAAQRRAKSLEGVTGADRPPSERELPPEALAEIEGRASGVPGPGAAEPVPGGAQAEAAPSEQAPSDLGAEPPSAQAPMAGQEGPSLQGELGIPRTDQEAGAEKPLEAVQSGVEGQEAPGSPRIGQESLGIDTPPQAPESPAVASEAVGVPEAVPAAEGQEGAVEAPQQPDSVFSFPGGLVRVPGVKQAAAFLKRNFTSRGDLPEAAQRANIARESEINAEVQRSQFVLRDFHRAVKADYKKAPNDLSPQELRQLDNLLKGEVVEGVPQRTREAVQAMREEIDRLSRRMLDSGMIEGDLEAHIRDNMGFYATRSYQVFDDPKWADKVPEEVRNRAKALLRKEYPKKSEGEIEGLIANLLYEGKAAESPMALISRAKLGSKDLSILTRRKEIAPEIRALYGEYKDPRANYARSVAKMANVVANHQFLETVRESGLGEFLHEAPVVRDGQEFKAKIAADESAVMAPLNGLYTTPEIQKAFQEATEAEQIPGWLRGWLIFNAMGKTSKTVLNLITAQRNVVGNIGFATANGHWRIWKGKEALRSVAEKWGLQSQKEWRDYYEKAIRLGVLHEDTRSGELRDVIKDATGQETSEWLENRTAKALKMPLRAAIGYYRVGDDVWKLYAWENEKARYRKAMPEASESEIEAMAAEIVRNTYPTYSLVPRGIKKLRRFPLTGPFLSFPAEVYRTTKNTLALTAKELKDPALRGIGAQRLVGSMVAASSTAALAMAFRHMLGITADDDDDARHFVPEWSKNSDLIWARWGDEHKAGQSRYIDMSYTDPYSYLKEPIRAMLRGDDLEEAAWEAFRAAADPFLQEEVATSAVIDVLRNKKRSTGGEVYNEEQASTTKAASVAGHIFEAIEPGTLNSLERFVKGVQGAVEPYGRTYDPKVEALAAFTGVRVTDFDIPQSLEFLGRDYKTSTNKASRMLTSVLQNQGTVTDEDIRDAYSDMKAARDGAFEIVSEAASAARSLGLSDEEVRAALKQAKVGLASIGEVMSGEQPLYAVTLATRKNMLAKLGQEEAERRLSVVADLTGTQSTSP